jgi:hypothetical protein
MYLQATTTAVWAPRGQTPVVRIHPGREEVNFYGTPMASGNLHTGQAIVMRSEVMNAGATAQHLKQILQTIPDVPILLLRNHGPWHSGLPIREVLTANPQEHIRKAARGAVFEGLQSKSKLIPR